MYYDRFDIVEAYLVFYIDYHGGQSSREYQRLSKIKTYYKPAHNWGYRYKDLRRNSKEIYKALVQQYQQFGALPNA